MTSPVGGGSPGDPNYNPGAQLQPNPDQVNEFHRYADTDNSPASTHHTLGNDPNQSSPGDHDHDGRNSKLLATASHTHSDRDWTSTSNSAEVSVGTGGAVVTSFDVTMQAGLYLIWARYFIKQFSPGRLDIDAGSGGGANSTLDSAGTDSVLGTMTPQFTTLSSFYVHTGGILHAEVSGFTTSGTFIVGNGGNSKWGTRLIAARISN